MTQKKLSRSEADEFLRRRAESMSVVTGRIRRERPLIDTPIWKDGGNLLTHVDGRIVHVMVGYERPLMEMSAELLCKKHGSVLNVGFGLGLIDRAIQRCGVQRHVIVEAHQVVLAWMREEDWMGKPGVEVIPSRWEDVNWVEYSECFDAVFFDPFPYDAPEAAVAELWRTVVRMVLKPEGTIVLYGPTATDEHVERLARRLWDGVRWPQAPMCGGCAICCP